MLGLLDGLSYFDKWGLPLQPCQVLQPLLLLVNWGTCIATTAAQPGSPTSWKWFGEPGHCQKPNSLTWLQNINSAFFVQFLSLRIVDNCRSVFLTWMMRLCKIWWQRKAKDIQGFCGNPRNPVGSLSRVADTGRKGEKKISGFSVGASSKSAICLRMRMHIENKHIEWMMLGFLRWLKVSPFSNLY